MNTKLTFADAVKRIEQIIDKMENGSDDIDELIKAYEEGAELILFCENKLTEVETRIEVISQKLTRKKTDN